MLWGAGNNQLSCAFNSALATAFRKPDQHFGLFFDLFIHGDSGLRIILLNVIENLVSVFDGEPGPLKLYDGFSAVLRSAMARRSTK